MDYKVICYKGKKPDRREIWRNHSFEDIRRKAQEWIEQGEADRIRVRDSAGRLVIRYPEWTDSRCSEASLPMFASARKQT